MAARTHTEDEIAYFRAKISELHLKRWKQYEIAQHLDLLQQMVSHYHCQNQAELRKSRLTDPVVAREEQIATIGLMERDLWAEINTIQQRRPDEPALQSKNDSAIEKNRQLLFKLHQERTKLLGLHDIENF